MPATPGGLDYLIERAGPTPTDEPSQRAWQRCAEAGRVRMAGSQASAAAAQGCATPLNTKSSGSGSSKIGLFAVLSLAVCSVSCGVSGLFAGPDDYARHHEADDSICVFSESIELELNRQNPSGHRGQPYDPQLWPAYWDSIIFYNVVEAAPSNPSRRGPTHTEILQWVALERRRLGLPDFLPTEKTGDVPARLYVGAESGHEAVEAWLSSRSRHCWAGPAAA